VSQQVYADLHAVGLFVYLHGIVALALATLATLQLVAGQCRRNTAGHIFENLLDTVLDDHTASAVYVLFVAAALHRWLDRLLVAAGPQLPHFPAKQLATTVWALGTLHHTPPRPWLLQLLSCTYQQLPCLNPGQISQVIWGLAELDTTPSPLWLSAFWARSGQILDKCSAAQIVDTAAAVAKLRLQPPGMWLRALTAAVNSNLGQFESGSLLEVLTAVQKLQAGRRANSSSRRAGSAADNGSSSSIVPFAPRQVQQWPQGVGIEGDDYVSSSSSRAGPAQVVVLRSAVARQQQQQHDQNREAGRQLEAMFGFDSSSSSTGLARSLRHQQSAVASLRELDAAAAEAYSMACLVVLMPDWLQSKVAQWPKHMAAERAALQQQQQKQCGQRQLQMSSVG
jgi:hypothetical protein